MDGQMSRTTDIKRKSEETDLLNAELPEKLQGADCDINKSIADFDFETTEELEPLDEIIGQDKAMSALEVGLGISQDGYNIYVSGLTGTGKMETIRRSLKMRIDGSDRPGDWVYVNNFDNPDQPWAIALNPGEGRRLQKEMDKLIHRLREQLPHAFRQEDFSQEKEVMGQKHQERLQEHIETLRQKAQEKGFEMSAAPDGRLMFIPLIDGKPPKEPEELEKLSDEDKKAIEEKEQELAREAARLSRRQDEIMRQLSEDVEGAERKFAAGIIQPMIETIKEAHSNNEKLLTYLDKVQEHLLDNLSQFQEKQKGKQAQLMAMMGGGAPPEPHFLEYKVNVVVDHSKSQTAPIVVEEAPTYLNLFGSIERTADQHGRLVTNFTQIKAGSLLRANGGYLVFNIEDALTEPFVYKNIKRALKASELRIESYNMFAPISVGALRPEPIPLTTKVVAVGRPIIYFLLRMFDDEFASIFKIKADFGTEMDFGQTQQMQYARFVRMIVKQERLRDFTAGAVGEVIKFAGRQTENKSKLLTRFSDVADLLREANYFASQDGQDGAYVTGDHVLKALDRRVFRSNRVAEKIRELIGDGTLHIEITGKRIGQINGLGILDLGDYRFGKPNRVTAAAGLGSEGLVNIERESKLSGSTHDKGVLILGGYLRNTYGQNKPLAVSASICFEQSYSGIEGDSASSAELYALLSTLANIPLRQDIAVTGSVDQWGRVQAIGGVNDKIEGFYDVCQVMGITGQQGVCIPASNVRNLVLRKDVRQAVEQGMFHIYPVKSIDQGLELLTGLKAGSVDEDATLHWHINRHLEQMAKSLQQFTMSTRRPKNNLSD